MSLPFVRQFGVQLRRCVLLIAGVCFSLCASAAEPQIASYSPAATVPGEILILAGSGFTGATEVFLEDWRRELVSAELVSVTDTELRVRVPQMRSSWHENHAVRITVLTSAGATVTLPADMDVVEAGQSITASGGGRYLVRDGGALFTGGAGSVFMYLESGAAAETGGGGGHTVYMEESSVLNLTGNAGGSRIVREEGAVVRLNGTPGEPPPGTVEMHRVPALRASLLSTLPRVLPVPTITSAAVASGTLGEPFLYTITTDEFNPTAVQFSATGLPPGLIISSGTGLISGTPQTTGVFAVTLTATNPNGSGNLLLTLSISTSLSPTLTNAPVAFATSGTTFSFTLQASNQPERFDATGLPEGLVFDTLSGSISGIPSTPGVFPVAVAAANAHGTGSAILLLLVDRLQPEVTGFSQGIARRDDQVRVAGRGFTGAAQVYFTNWRNELVPASFIVESDTSLQVQIPDILTSWVLNHESRMLVITPAGATVTIPPTFVEVRTSVAPSSLDFYLVRSGGSLAGGGSGGVVAYLERGASAQTGQGGSHTYFVDAGASIAVGNSGGGHLVVHAAGARISGTPGGVLGVSSLIPSFPEALLRILPTPKIVSELAATGTVGQSFFYEIRVERPEPELTYRATGLPPGLVINANSGVISGAPTTAGTFPVALFADNMYGAGTARAIFVIADPQIPIITTRGSFNVEIGRSFSLQIAASHNPTLYRAAGLPVGLTIDSATGLITGTPTVGGVYPVSLSATNANGTGTAEISIVVGARSPRIFSLPLAAGIGSTIELRGEGFTGTSAVAFTDWRGEWVTAGFRVVSDALLEVIVPAVVTHPALGDTTRIHIITAAGATVTIPPDFIEVTTSIVPSFAFYVVQNGGSLGGGGSGGVVAYLRSGASAATGGGGSHMYFVESGATLNLGSGGGGHQVISAQGSVISGTPARHIQVPALTPSFVSNLLRIAPVPSITSNRQAFASLGLPFIYAATATNSPTAFGAERLPPGLSINALNGIISGRVSGGEATYEVTLTASNSSGTGSATVTLAVRDDYRQWKETAFFSLPGGAAHPAAQDLADADGDGISNVIEFSAGLDPLRNNPGAWSLRPVAGGETPRFCYRRLKGAGTGSTETGYTLGTITYTLLASSDLASWRTGAEYFTQEGPPIDNGDGTESVTVTLDAAADRFIKLQISHRQL